MLPLIEMFIHTEATRRLALRSGLEPGASELQTRNLIQPLRGKLLRFHRLGGHDAWDSAPSESRPVGYGVIRVCVHWRNL
jgi:hypothetical protein